MFYLIYQAHPAKVNSDKEKYEGAHIGCWINVETKRAAQNKAKKMIQNHQWSIDKFVEGYPIKKHEVQSAKGQEYFDQALVDGEVLVFYTSAKRAGHQ